MNYEVIKGLQIPKIGLGTWKIGGASWANRSQDAGGLAALRSAIELGYTHFDTAEIYAAGHTEELLGRAVRDSGLRRVTFFIASKVKPEHLRYNDVLKACEGSLRRLAMDYIDLYLIHWPGFGMKLPDAFRALNQLVREGKVRHLGVSNFDLKLLKSLCGLSETPILTDQVPYSLSDRSYVRNGVLAYCQESGILLTAYAPVDQGQFRPTSIVRLIAKAHSATPEQIALAWLVAQQRVITIPMSQDPIHQRQNLEAAAIKLTPAEIAELTG